jgi:CBS domain-containing protein
MENPAPGGNDHTHDPEFKRFAVKRIIFFTLLGVVAIWVVGAIIEHFEKPVEIRTAQKFEDQTAHESSKNGRQAKTLPRTTVKEPSRTATEEKGRETTAGPLEYGKDTAGGIMTTDFVALDKDLTADEAVAYLKNTRRGIKQPDQLLVVDENQRLIGIVTVNQLLFASPETPIKNVMSTDIHSVRTGSETKKVKSLIDRHQLPFVPVTDNANKLVGVVKADQVIHLAEQGVEKTTKSAETPSHDMTGSDKEAQETPSHESPPSAAKAQAPGHQPAAPAHETAEKKAGPPALAAPGKTTAEAQKEPAPKAPKAEAAKSKAVGVAFVEAAIKPLNYELNERFWGWRANDIFNFTDNINNFQLGVLEVTRRTVVALAERISRTGTTAAFDDNLENAMNWLMIKARKYWFPSPETKYNASLNELRAYIYKLEKGEAKFHTRTDNLIPLLMDFEDLLGSCEENLVKTKEDDGSSVSFFKADDYFYYAKGVASAMGTILEGVLEDFKPIIDSRRGIDTLHHAIESCHEASEINPWIITDSSLSGILANHRANMAAPLSHARFYIGVLIKTLST